ncbi:MAG TPA: response regulator, partial [Spirochaetota bacterium]|nr:response regulator [Spirochaetota bacterium]
MDNMRISILLVDDEEKIVTRLARILSKEGYDVDMVSSGSRAIERLGENTYDIILTDLNMPDLSGFDIMEHIQKNGIETLPLVLTGYASVEGAIQAIKSGAYDFIE